MRKQFVQQAEFFRHKLAAHVGEAGYIAAWPTEAGHEAKLDRVYGGAENYRNCRSQGLGRERARCAFRASDYVDLAANEIGGQFGQPIAIILRKAKFDREISSFDQ